MAKIYGDAAGGILRFYQTDAEEIQFGDPPGFASVLEFDPETNPQIIASLGSDWNNHAFADGVLYYHGAAVIVNPPGDRWNETQRARTGLQDFYNLPGYATWTPNEAEAYVNANVLNGYDYAQVDAWIDANITGTTVAQLRAQTIAALKVLAHAVIDLRGIVGKVAAAIMFMRDVALRRFNQ